MKVAIVGSRKFRSLHLVKEYVNNLPEDTIVVSGGAKGVDTAAKIAAEARGLPKPKVFKPKYDKYPKHLAPLMRNSEIVEFSDRVVAFWNGYSGGTQDTLRKARKLGLPIEVIEETWEEVSYLDDA